ncbi:MAG: hypothetical protein D8M59_06865 [Planctomycetes bacterium]|nr:hypothetical protein [Planctomycetota bacterium]NOG54375.1 hypothetical protein [Planctomycetota bacterium]
MLNHILAVLVVVSLFSGPGWSDTDVVTLHVAPQASPEGTGSAAHPFRTITEARDAVRMLRSAPGRPATGYTVVLHGGEYLLDASLVFVAEDGGTADDPIVYRAAPGEQPVLVGGLMVHEPQWHPVVDEGILRRLPDDGARREVRQLDLRAVCGPAAVAQLAGPVHRGMGVAGTATGSEAFLNGMPLTRSRWPNLGNPDRGFVTISRVVDTGSIPRNRADDIPPEKRETGPARGGTFRLDTDRLARWTTATDVWAFGYWFHDWADEQLPVEQIDVDAGEITLGLPHRYGLKSGTHLYITNLIEELDSPGEYYIDTATGILYVYPVAAPPTDRERVLISTLAAPVITVDNSESIRFVGLVIEGTRGTAIEATNVHDVVIEQCTIRNTGGDGIDLSGTHNVIRRNTLEGIGGTGITVTGGDRASLTSAGNEVVGNEVSGFGRVWRTYHPAIRVSGVGQHVANNRLHDGPHSAIIFSGNDHVFELNEVYDVLYETGDSGAIYCGRDWTMHGNVIRHNLFHHITGSSSRWQNGVYLDDMASGIHVIGNIFYECNWGMLIGGGRDLKIRHNVFIGGRQAIRFDARGVDWMAPHIADPSTSTLHRNLEAVPYRSPPWSQRFPELQRYLTDGFGRPVGSAVIENVMYSVPFGSVADTDAVRVEGNAVYDALPAWVHVDESPIEWFGSSREMVVDIAEIPGFEPIPAGRIGLLVPDQAESEEGSAARHEP